MPLPNSKMSFRFNGHQPGYSVNQGESSAVPPLVHDVLHSPGQPFDAATRSFMESRFGHDFSHVRVHTDTRAVESARAVGALAYTAGKDVVFGAGQYIPWTDAGKKLLAHELTHVVQQTGRCRNGGTAQIQRFTTDEHKLIGDMAYEEASKNLWRYCC